MQELCQDSLVRSKTFDSDIQELWLFALSIVDSLSIFWSMDTVIEKGFFMSQISPSVLQSQKIEIVAQELDNWSIHISDVDEFMDEPTRFLQVFFYLPIFIEHKVIFYGI